jgi:hypothetical protein
LSRSRWLFKAVTIKGDNIHGEDWSEKAVSHLAALLGVPCARIELAVLHGRAGCISANLRPDSHELQHGQVFLQVCGAPGYVPGKGKVHPGHTLENIQASLSGALPPPGCQLPFDATAYDVFAGYVLLDAWVANRDRHDNNWAVLRPLLEPAGPLRLCGSYDHASNPSTTLVQLAAMALQLASADAWCYWFEKLRNISEDEVRNVIARVPGMSDLARTFAETVLGVNRRRILDDCA